LGRKRTKLLTNENLDIRINLPWDSDPIEARRIYQTIYRESHRTDPEIAILKELGIKPRRKRRK
jgi:hypothetical protein